MRDRIAAVLLGTAAPAHAIEDRRNEPPPPQAQPDRPDEPRSFDYAFGALPRMLDPMTVPPPTPLSRALGSDELDAAMRRKGMAF